MIGLIIILSINILMTALFLWVNRKSFRGEIEFGILILFSILLPGVIPLAFYIDNYLEKNKRLVKTPDFNFLTKLKNKELTVVFLDSSGKKVDLPDEKQMELNIAVTSLMK